MAKTINSTGEQTNGIDRFEHGAKSGLIGLLEFGTRLFRWGSTGNCLEAQSRYMQLGNNCHFTRLIGNSQIPLLLFTALKSPRRLRISYILLTYQVDNG